MRIWSLPSTEFRSASYRQTARTPFFSVKVKLNNAGRWRLGIVAGVAVNKSAAKRNFLKRQTREAVKAALDMFPGRGEGDILVILSSKTKALHKKEFREKMIAAAKDAVMVARKNRI